MTMVLNWDLTPAAYIKMLVTEVGRYFLILDILLPVCLSFLTSLDGNNKNTTPTKIDFVINMIINI